MNASRVVEVPDTKLEYPQVTIISRDLSKVGSAYERFKEVKEKHRLNIDFMVNNAGNGVRGLIW